MTKSHDRLPMASPLIPNSVMISRAESSSIVLPLCRRLETTGYFTNPPVARSPRKYSAAFHLVEKKWRLFLAFQGLALRPDKQLDGSSWIRHAESPASHSKHNTTT